MLRQANQSPTLAPAVAKAIEVGSRAQMGIDPVSGAVMLALLLATSRFERTADGGYTCDFGRNAPDIIKALQVPEFLAKLPALVKALTPAVVAKLLGPG